MWSRQTRLGYEHDRSLSLRSIAADLIRVNTSIRAWPVPNPDQSDVSTS